MKHSELKRILDAATPGPWWDEAMIVEVESCIAASRKEAGLSPLIATDAVGVMSSHVEIADCSTGLSDRPLEEVLANSKLIATSRGLLPLLLQLWEATEGMRRAFEHSVSDAMLDGLPGGGVGRIVSALAALDRHGEGEK